MVGGAGQGRKQRSVGSPFSFSGFLLPLWGAARKPCLCLNRSSGTSWVASRSALPHARPHHALIHPSIPHPSQCRGPPVCQAWEQNGP